MSGSRARLKDLAALNPETLTDATDPEFAFRYIDIGSASRGYLRHEPEFLTFGDAPSRARRVLRPGDTILSTVRTYLRAAWTVREAPDQLVASTGFVCLRPRQGVNARYLGWLVQSDVVVEEVVARSVGVSYPAINPVEVGRIEVHRPSLTRQRAIADYLDRETAHTDRLIAAHRRMASLLIERQQSLVSDVTHAAAVVSIDHIVPPGWSRISLRRCLRSSQYGIGESTEASGRYAVLGMSNVHAGEVVDEPSGFVSDVDETLLLSPGDLLFNRTNSRELVGKVGIVRALEEPTTFASYLVRLRTNDLVAARYLNYLLNTREVLGLARSMALPSIGQANLNPSRYSAIVLPLPPAPEQERIILRLDAEAQRVGHASQRLGMQVELLRERRQALITAAVTGELEIPEAA